MASWEDSERGDYTGTGPNSTAGSGSGSARDGASASAASCSSLLGPEAALELLPSAALVFNTQGQLIGVNSKAAELHPRGLWSGAPLSSFTGGAELMDGRKLGPDELQNSTLQAVALQFQQQGDARDAPRWLLSQANLVQHPVSGDPCIVLVQTDISEAKKMCLAHAAAEERTRERMQALQRKLVRAVTEAEAMRHVVERLQAQVLGLRRQMQAAGVVPEVPLDEAILRPSPHQDMYAAMLSSVQDATQLLDPAVGSASPRAPTPPPAGSAGGAAPAAAMAPAGRGSGSSAVESGLPQPAFVGSGGASGSPVRGQTPPFGDAAGPGGIARQAQLAKANADALFYRAGFEKAVDAAAEQKATLDRVIVKEAAATACYESLLAETSEAKARWDRRSAAQQTQLNKAEAELLRLRAARAAEAEAGRKAAFDALLATSAAQKAQLDKVTADAVAFKAGYDKAAADAALYKETLDRVTAVSTAQKARLDKVTADAAEFKAGYDKLTVDAVEQKAVFDKATADAAEFKAGYDKLAVDNLEQQARLDKATADAAEFKAGYDKLTVDAIEQKAVFDKVTADAAEFKAGYDKLAVDNLEQQARLDKATADAAEFKAGYDKLTVDAIEQQAQLDKATADAAEFKAGYDKLTVDAVEQKAVFDKVTADAAEFKAGYDKLAVDNLEQQARLDKATADAAEFKAGYDKLTVDAVEQKAVFDKVTADAAEFKAGYDKLAVDTMEQKAQLDKATADAAEFKAGYDKLTVDAIEQKAVFDKVTADAAEFKAGYDKLAVDNLEQQARLDKAAADAAEFKAGYDKLTVDAIEQKAVFDKVAADAAEFKAGYDKLTVDTIVQQAQLDKATADAAEFKAGYDKVTADAAEFKAGFDKATADAAEFKAGYDKLTVDTIEQKAQLDKVTADAAEFKAGYDKVTADAAEFKAGFDKMVVDSVEQKAQLDKLTADAAEFKAGYDKALADAVEQKAEFDEREEELRRHHASASEAASRHKAAADKAALDMTRMAADMTSAHEALLKEREALNSLQDQHEQLLRAQEVLQAELSMALGSYQPKASIDAGTPADKLLAMMTELLDGSLPNLQDILLIQSTILEARDIYQPFRLGKQLMESSALGNDVGLSLIHLLGDADSMLKNRNAQLKEEAAEGVAVSLKELCERRDKKGSRGSVTSANEGSSCGEDDHEGASFANLAAALAAIIAAPSAEALGRPAGASDASLPPDLSSGGSATRASALLHGAAIRRKPNTAARRGSTTALALAGGADGGAALGSGTSLDTLVAAAAAAGPSPALLDKVERLLAQSHEWHFDMFELADATQGHPLSTLAYFVFQREGLVPHFGISPVTLARFLRRMEEGYRLNPYHNAIHAADVLQSLSTIIHRGGMATAYVDPLYMLACYTAAVLHDFEHGGLTNDFLVSSTDPLAVVYNDKSPLENHHLAAAFMVLQQPEYNFTAVLTKPQVDKFRKAVIELVLATDMKQHFSILSHFTTVHRLNAGGSLTPTNGSSCPPHAAPGAAPNRGGGAAGGAGGAARGGAHGDPHGGPLSGPGAGSSASGSDARSALEEEKILLPLDENERLLSLQMALKCADLGHLTGALPVHKRWVERLEQEYFLQGDIERANGMPISPLFDRNHAGITRSQVGFFDIVAIPLYSTLARVFPGTKPLLVYLLRNYRYWVDAQQAAAAPGGGGGASGSGSK